MKALTFPLRLKNILCNIRFQM